MTKDKIQKLKKRIKDNAPAIIIGVSTVAAVGAALYVKKNLKINLTSNLEDDLGGALFMTNGDLELMKNQDTPIRYPAPDGVYTVSFDYD